MVMCLEGRCPLFIPQLRIVQLQTTADNVFISWLRPWCFVTIRYVAPGKSSYEFISVLTYFGWRDRGTRGYAGKTVKSHNNACCTSALLRWVSSKRHYTKCPHFLSLPSTFDNTETSRWKQHVSTWPRFTVLTPVAAANWETGSSRDGPRQRRDDTISREFLMSQPAPCGTPHGRSQYDARLHNCTFLIFYI